VTPFAARTFPLILAAPSGAGKTSIAHGLRKRRRDVCFSISATTRSPRADEVHGRDYWFVDEPEFRRMEGAGELAEWADVHGNLYGTPLRNVEEARRDGLFLLLDIDVQGARQIVRAVPDAVSVFVLPPSGAALVERLRRRGSESSEVLERRLRNAAAEIRTAGEFDYVVINEHLERSVDAVDGILQAEAHRAARAEELDGWSTVLAEEIEARCSPNAPHLVPTHP
jgi:guanylate kinase